MNQLELSMAKKVARIIRTARKQKGLNQRDVAQRLGITQGNLSKMEHAMLIPSAPQWFEFCELVQISPMALKSGYLERGGKAQVQSGSSESGFSLPRDYSDQRGSKVRAMIPFLMYFEGLLGAEYLDTYLKSLRVDPDFFTDLDHQINLNFCLDITRFLASKGHLRKKDVPKLVKPIHLEQVHGSLFSVYQQKEDPLNRLKILLLHSKNYECNFAYQVEEDKRNELVFGVLPEQHLSQFGYKNDPTLDDFLCTYKKSYFEKFAAGTSSRPVVLTELECHYHGADRCIYKLKT